MCSGPVGDGSSYWGLIQLKISGGALSESDLEAFKKKLTDFLNGQTVTAGLPVNVQAGLANGTIKVDDAEDGTSIQLINRK